MNLTSGNTKSFWLLKSSLCLVVILFTMGKINAQTPNLNGSWTMYDNKNVKYEKSATINQQDASITVDNGYGSTETVSFDGSTFISSGLKATVSADRTRIFWSNNFVWVRSDAPQSIELPVSVEKT